MEPAEDLAAVVAKFLISLVVVGRFGGGIEVGAEAGRDVVAVVAAPHGASVRPGGAEACEERSFRAALERERALGAERRPELRRDGGDPPVEDGSGGVGLLRWYNPRRPTRESPIYDVLSGWWNPGELVARGDVSSVEP